MTLTMPETAERHDDDTGAQIAESYDVPMHQQAQDYGRVEQALRFIAENRIDQPSLEVIAEAMGLSASHAQRIFTRWAGISPKKFLGYLTLEHAKASLKARGSVLDAALDAGLSGPSRLHDLCLTFEGMTPGEYKAKGAELTLSFGFHDTPFGEALALATLRGLCHLAFVIDGDRAQALDEAQQAWPLSPINENPKATAPLVAACFKPRSSTGEALTVIAKGTAFQIQVWKALLALPPGHPTTYGALAKAIGRPGAARAVGTACGHNRLGFVIPCHRVIREVGGLGGYHWGLERKQAIMAWEEARSRA